MRQTKINSHADGNLKNCKLRLLTKQLLDTFSKDWLNNTLQSCCSLVPALIQLQNSKRNRTAGRPTISSQLWCPGVHKVLYLQVNVFQVSCVIQVAYLKRHKNI